MTKEKCAELKSPCEAAIKRAEEVGGLTLPILNSLRDVVLMLEDAMEVLEEVFPTPCSCSTCESGRNRLLREWKGEELCIRCNRNPGTVTATFHPYAHKANNQLCEECWDQLTQWRMESGMESKVSNEDN
jgi:hypothetical protein